MIYTNLIVECLTFFRKLVSREDRIDFLQICTYGTDSPVHEIHTNLYMRYTQICTLDMHKPAHKVQTALYMRYTRRCKLDIHKPAHKVQKARYMRSYRSVHQVHTAL